jgi:hypothetical protein
LIIILLFCSIFDFFKKGELILTVLTIPIVVSGLIQINSSLLDNQLPVLSRYGLAYNHNYAQNCRVSNTPANQETVYSIINEDALIHNTKNYRASLLFHNISFMHNTAMQAIGLLKDNNAPRWFYLPNALDPRGELEFDFFLETPGKTPDYFYFAIDTGGTKTTDTRNYQNFQSYITRVPDSFWAQATHVADVSGRDGMLVQIYRLEPGSFDRKILADMAKYAALFDPLHATQHRIREIRFGLEYGTRTHEDAENILSLTALNSLDASVKELYPERSADIDFILFRAPGLRAAAVTPFRKDYLPEELAALREIETDNEYFTTKSADSGFCVAIPPRLAGKKISVSIELTAPEGSKILYCQYALNCPPWLNMPISTLSHRLAEGHQKMSFVIPENSASGMLRFSLEGTPGTYRIHGVTLSE